LLLVSLVLFTDMAGYDLVVPILPEYARSWGIGEAELGVLFACYAVTLLLSVPLAGWLCQRLGDLRTLQLGVAGLFVSQVLYATAMGHAMLFAARALHGVAGGTAWTAGVALLALEFPARQRGRALGLAMTAMSLGTLVGPPLGGLLFSWGGPRLPFLVTAVWTLLLTGIVLGMRARLTSSSRPAHGSSLWEGWTGYLHTIGAVILGSMFLSALEPTLPLHLHERFGANPAQTGLVFGLAALVYGLTSPLAGWAADVWGGRRVLIAGLIACLMTLPWLAVPRTWAGEIVALSCFGLACAFLLTPTLPEIAAVCERRSDQGFGAAYAIFNLAYAIGMVIGPVTAGLLKRGFGFGPTLLIFSGVAALALPMLVVPVRAGSVSDVM